MKNREFNRSYEGEHLNHVAFPLGGIGAGMMCLDGTGALTHISLRHHPHIDHEPMMLAAVFVKGQTPMARVLEGPVLPRKIFGNEHAGNGGMRSRGYGFPRFAEASFEARFPFATLKLSDPKVPVRVTLTAWSPFTPPDPDDSSLPVAALEYTLTNNSDRELDLVFSYHAMNFMRPKAPGGVVKPLGANGFIASQGGTPDKPWEEGAFAVVVDDPSAKADCHWFRGGWFDPATVLWNTIARGESPSRPAPAEGDPSPGGSVYAPFRLRKGESRTLRVLISWYVPQSDLATPDEFDSRAITASADRERYRPWYVSKFADIKSVASYWQANCAKLCDASRAFSDCFFSTTLPPEVVEAVAANLTILKSPTVLRQPDGKMWAWEGCGDKAGCCTGTCTHVWNYAQAIAHLFPSLERTLRETEFEISQDDRGHQTFRAALPIRPPNHDFHAAADGQLGGIMKAYREWRISGDSAWLRRIWKSVRMSLDYCINVWDPRGTGTLEEPHHNTYDIEFWGPDGMCTSIYLGALAAAIAMGEALNDDVKKYRELLAHGRAAMEGELYNGEYFIQKVKWEGLNAQPPTDIKSMVGNYSTEAAELLRKEGPKYQYGDGCLSDGVLGAWLAEACGVAPFLDAAKVRSHLAAIHKHNLRTDLSEHANPQRPGYAIGHEGGLLLCTWPRGGRLTLPFVYSEEVWTGIEYQVAAHLMMVGLVDKGLDIVRAARERYDGRVRNPFDEYECGHWYARAMSSYALIQGMTGIRYDAVEKVLHVSPNIPGDHVSFISTATGYGCAGVRGGKPFLDVKHGTIPVSQIAYVESRLQVPND